MNNSILEILFLWRQKCVYDLEHESSDSIPKLLARSDQTRLDTPKPSKLYDSENGEELSALFSLLSVLHLVLYFSFVRLASSP